MGASSAEKGSGIDAVGGSSFHTRREKLARQLAVSVVFTEASGQLPRADGVSAKEAGSLELFENMCIMTFWSPNAASSADGVDPEGTLVITRLALSEQVAAERIGVWKAPAGCRTESTTAMGDDVLNVCPNSAAEYDRGRHL